MNSLRNLMKLDVPRSGDTYVFLGPKLRLSLVKKIRFDFFTCIGFVFLYSFFVTHTMISFLFGGTQNHELWETAFANSTMTLFAFLAVKGFLNDFRDYEQALVEDILRN